MFARLDGIDIQSEQGQQAGSGRRNPLAEKIGIVIGLFLFGYLTEITKSQRTSVLSCMTFFAIGLVMLIITLRRSKKAGNTSAIAAE
jgi:hypothetical protein